MMKHSINSRALGRLEVRVDWRVTLKSLTQITKVCVYSESKCHQSFVLLHKSQLKISVLTIERVEAPDGVGRFIMTLNFNLSVLEIIIFVHDTTGTFPKIQAN